MKDKRIEAVLDACEIKTGQWSYVAEIRLADIDRAKSHDNQVRAVTPLIADAVESYKIHLAAGHVFPPVVLDGKAVIDGNNRIEAGMLLQWEAWPHGAYVLSELSDAQRARLRATFNVVLNGVRATRDDQLRAALSLVKMAGMTSTAAALLVGLSSDAVQNFVFDGETQERAEGTGIKGAAGVSSKTRRAINTIQLDSLYRKALETVVKKRLTADEAVKLANAAKKASSEKEAAAKMDKVVEDLRPVLGAASEPKAYQRFLRLSEPVFKITPDLMAEIPTDYARKTMERMERMKAWMDDLMRGRKRATR